MNLKQAQGSIPEAKKSQNQVELATPNTNQSQKKKRIKQRGRPNCSLFGAVLDIGDAEELDGLVGQVGDVDLPELIPQEVDRQQHPDPEHRRRREDPDAAEPNTSSTRALH